MELLVKKKPSGELFLEIPDELLSQLSQLNQLGQLSETLKGFSTEVARLKENDGQTAKLQEEIARLKDPDYLKGVIQEWADGISEEAYRQLGEYREFPHFLTPDEKKLEESKEAPAKEPDDKTKPTSTVLKIGDKLYPVVEE